MNILILGATGMVGEGVLRECILATDVGQVTTLGRTATQWVYPKLRQIVHSGLDDLSPVADQLRGFDACFFCLGVSSSGIDEAAYSRLTYDLTIAVARQLIDLNPNLTFVYVSGAGTDISEKGKSMWARVKGRTENALLRLPFKAVYLFRPGLIRPMHGARSKTPLYRYTYTLLAPLLPVVRALMPSSVLTTELMGRAMLYVVRNGAPTAILETADINRAGQI